MNDNAAESHPADLSMLKEDKANPEFEDTTLTGGIDPQKIAEEARSTFSLSERLSRGKKKLSTGSVLVFLDVEAMQEYSQIHADAKLQRDLLESLEKVKDLEPSDREKYDEQLVLVAELNEREEAARAAMLEEALSVHLRAYPDIAVKVAQREARKIFIDPDTGLFKPEFDSTDSADWMEKRLLSESIVKVVDHTGAEVELDVPKAERGAYFAATLHAAQFQRLMGKYNEVCLVSGISNAAVEDPGF